MPGNRGERTPTTPEGMDHVQSVQLRVAEVLTTRREGSGKTLLPSRLRQALERLNKLLQTALVRELDLEVRAAYAGLVAGQSLEGLASAVGKRGIDGSSLRARLLLRAGPAGCALRRPHRQPLANDLPRQPAAALLVGNGEHGAGMTLAQLAALHHAQHV